MTEAIQQSARHAARIENLCVRFSGKTVISVPKLKLIHGQIHVISGPSGSGKTSLLRSFNRLNECFPHCQTSGRLFLELDRQSIDIQSLRPSQLPALRQKVAMVFQSPNVLPGSIAHNLMLPLKVTRRIKGAHAEQITREALQQAKLWNEVKQRLHHPARSLSGGQQQRLCLARALALEPEIMLLDEPTASLDPEVTEQIENLLLELRGRYTMILVSHSRRQTEKLADSQLHCQNAKITESTGIRQPPHGTHKQNMHID